MGQKRKHSSGSESASSEDHSDETRLKSLKKTAKLAKKAKKQQKKEKKKARKLKKKAKKLKKLRRKLREAGDSVSSPISSSSSSSAAPASHEKKSVEQQKVSVVEESRQSVGLKLFGEIYATGKPDSVLKWDYPLRDEKRRCFVGLLRPELPQASLKRFHDLVRNGAHWDQPKRPTGELLPRKTDWLVSERCRCRYKYGGVEVDPSEFPPWMEELMEICMPLCGLRGRARWPNCCNLNLYEDGGMSVGWHADDEELFQGQLTDCAIISFSLGQSRSFEVRVSEPEVGEAQIHKIQLSDGDLLTMEGLMQKHYEHRVPRDRCTGPRINLTWRWIKKHQARCPLSR